MKIKPLLKILRLRKMIHRNNGFTLVELAIVIVIIGLLVTGVLQGQELIRQSRINNTISQIKNYDAVVNTFKAKYNALPGDISKASLFGLNAPKGSSSPNTCSAQGEVVTTTTGGNGNGDNFLNALGGVGCQQIATVGYINNYGGGGEGWRGELANFFVHLSNSQLIKESFNQPAAIYNTNAINLQYPSTSVGIAMVALSEGSSTYWILGSPISIFNVTNTFGNNLTPTEAYGVDSKLDDGNPTTGIVQATTGVNASNSFVIATGSASTCVFTGNITYNMAGTYENRKLCTLRIFGNF
jgi:prepilin-type N-terminal cleavage/methylation domain-containing protein